MITFTSSRHRLGLIVAMCFVAATGTSFAIFLMMLPYQLNGMFLGLFAVGVMVAATIIYYKVSGKPLPASSASG